MKHEGYPISLRIRVRDKVFHQQVQISVPLSVHRWLTFMSNVLSPWCGMGVLPSHKRAAAMFIVTIPQLWKSSNPHKKRCPWHNTIDIHVNASDPVRRIEQKTALVDEKFWFLQNMWLVDNNCISFTLHEYRWMKLWSPKFYLSLVILKTHNPPPQKK